MSVLKQQADTELHDILIHASQESEYYRTYFSANNVQRNIPELSDFSYVTHQTIQKKQGSFLCDRYQRYPDIEYLLLKRSFGLSGIPMEIYWDSRDDVRSQNFLGKYRKNRFGVTDDERCCVFRTAEYAGNKIMDDMPRRLSWDKKTLSFTMCDLSLEYLQICMESILAFNPVWMVLPPGVALMLAENIIAKKKSLPSALRYIELYGEMPDTQVENKIQDVFQVQIGNIYATQATGVVAASCSQGHFHIFPKNVFVEVIHNGQAVVGEEGDICLTSLQNKAMPLIRFKTGDKGVLQTEPCSCGQQEPVLRLTRGRNRDLLTMMSGEKISPWMLRSLVEYTNEEVSRCLANIRFKQTGNDSMDVILSLKPAFSGWEDEVIRVFKNKIQKSCLRQMRWKFIFNDLDKRESEYQSFFEPWKGGE